MVFLSNLESRSAPHSQMSETSQEAKSNAETYSPVSDPNTSDSNSSDEHYVAEALISELLEYGSMNYLSLIKCAGKNKRSSRVHKYFNNLSMYETLEFFKGRTSKFNIDDNGYVTPSSSVKRSGSEKPTEATVVEYFTSVLRTTSGIPLEVFVKYLQSTITISSSIKNYFDPCSMSSIHEFLKSHPSRFVIDRYSFVSLRETEGVAQNKEPANKESEANNGYTDFAGATDTCEAADFHNLGIINSSVADTSKRSKENTSYRETIVLKCLSSVLSSEGSMHFLALLKCAARKPYVNCLRKLDPIAKFMFFENHSNTFTIRNDGYVILGSIKINKLQEDKLVNYFVSILRTARRMSCAELVKRLEDSNLDAKTHFVPINCTNLIKFFKEHNSWFVVEQDFSISLSTKDEQNSEMVQITDHVTKSSKAGKRNTTKTCECDVNKHSNSHISSTYIDSASPIKKVVTETLVSILMKYGSMHYMALIRFSDGNNSDIVLEYFSRFTRTQKFEFFQNHSTTFIIDSYGYVTLRNEALERLEEKAKQEEKVVEYLTSVLEASHEMHYVTLVRLLQNSDTDVKNYFDGYSESEIRVFFTKHCSRFALRFPSCVSLCGRIRKVFTQDGNENGAKVKQMREKKGDEKGLSPFPLDRGINVSLREKFREQTTLNGIFNYVQESGKVERIKINGEKNIHETKESALLDPYAGLSSTTEDSVDEILLSMLSKRQPMHYLTLIWAGLKNEKILKYFDRFSSTEKFTYFKNRSNSFVIADDGYVTPNTLALEKLKVKKAKEEQVMGYFSSILKSMSKLHYFWLIASLRHSNLSVKNYFDSYSDSELYSFFKSRPLQFSIGEDSLVSLPEEIPKLGKESLAQPGKLINSLESKGSETCKVNKSHCSPKPQTRMPTASKWENSDGCNVHNKTKSMCNINEMRENKNYENKPSPFPHDRGIYISFSEEFPNFPARKDPANYVLESDSVIKVNTSVDENNYRTKISKFLDTYSGSSGTTEETVVEILLSKLLERGSMQYLNLISSGFENKEVLKYFENFSASEKFSFFSNRSHNFVISPDGYVAPSKLALEKLQIKKNSGKSVINRATSKSMVYNSGVVSHVLSTTAVSSITDKSFTNTVDLPTGVKLDLVQRVGLLHSNGETAELCASGISCTISEIVEETLIGTLVSVLMKHVSMHYIFLIEIAAENDNSVQEYFSHFSSLGKFKFFKQHSNTFDVYDDGYVTISRSAFERLTKEAGEGEKHVAYTKPLYDILEVKKRDEDEIIKYFTSVLKITGKTHYVKLMKCLQSSNLRLKNYFDTYSDSELYWFFKTYPSEFAIDENFYVSIQTIEKAICSKEGEFMHPEKMANALKSERSGIPGFDKLSCSAIRSGKQTKRETSTPNQVDNNLLAMPKSSLRKCISATTLTPSESKCKTTENKCSVIKNHKQLVNNKATNKSANTQLDALCPSSEVVSVKKACVTDVAVLPIEQQQQQQQDSAQMVLPTNKTAALSLPESHIKCVRCLVAVLKAKRNSHYRQLLYEGCRYSRDTFSFFSKFTLEDVLEFIQMHPMYFSVQKNGNVKLVVSKITIYNILASKIHVIQVTLAMQAKTSWFFVKILLERKRVALLELKFLLGFAPGYIISYFKANYPDFSKFFQYRPECFRVCGDGFVELSSKPSETKKGIEH